MFTRETYYTLGSPSVPKGGRLASETTIIIIIKLLKLRHSECVLHVVGCMLPMVLHLSLDHRWTVLVLIRIPASIKFLHKVINSPSSILLPLILWHARSHLCHLVSIYHSRIVD
jgi:hypothetical protein